MHENFEKSKKSHFSQSNFYTTAQRISAVSRTDGAERAAHPMSLK
jgi:hypothetical protein